MKENEMEISVSIVRKLAKARFRHYVFIMYNYRSVICSSTQLLVLPPIALIQISYRSQYHDLGALPNS